ncbi:hypothetical protein IW140_004719 [Coemansia sp. RSA 1813]|nr:hypothetical protein EV178_005403 [Coemansia sp. RSA 1646]KAJ1770405.1 hypothetical protein LPJ74_003212 [Coemansia sp. RSA 1843]KAJ2088221.1 hypothetical protein IW138_004393 [Coemansia sp. RSA 986]KAJ2215736.1 hypothetical protein EV179_001960 [Coemansia sp. RSA 487]KAJ2566928.1 hypothetical protein IW140_004719 [Coemansia sp. RSA 1813]
MSATPVGSAGAHSTNANASSSNSNNNSSNAASSTHNSKRLRLDRQAAWRAAGDILPLRKYTPTPSNGTAPLHSMHDYGYTDFYPARDSDNEGQLSERTIRHGYVDMPRVENEYLSSHDVVFERLQDQRVFQEFQSFAAGTAQRQWARGYISSTDFPRLPNRTVRSDERCDEWFRGLANPRVPLSVLANSMPFGLRGEMFLDMLRQHRVPLQRAVWAIRLTGVYEMFGMQTRDPDHANLKALEKQYTSQWSKQFTQFLEHTLNSAPTTAGTGTSLPTDSMSPAAASSTGATPSATPHKTQSASIVALNASSPAAWARSWEFCLSLLHAQYGQGLLDQRYFVSWIVSQFRQTSVDKCMLLLPLIQDYTQEIGKSRTPLRKLISAVAYWLSRSTSHPSLHPFHTQISEYLITLFTTFPDAFVEPSTWSTYRSALCDAIDSVSAAEQASTGNASSYAVVLKQVDTRNSRFECIPYAKRLNDLTNAIPEDKRLMPLHILGTLTPDTKLGTVFNRLFSDLDASTSTFANTIRLICYWAVEDQLLPAVSQFRFLSAASLCRMSVDRQTTDNSNSSRSPNSISNEVQSAVVNFLDIFTLPSAAAEHKDAVWRVCSLLEQLADVGCFSISKYLQLLTARGDFFGAKVNSTRSKRQLEYALGVPTRLDKIEEQRQMVLGDWQASGTAAKNLAHQYCLAQSALAARIRNDISALLPFLMAYTCATPFRTTRSNKQPVIDADVVRWWAQSTSDWNNGNDFDMFDQDCIPKAPQFARCKLLSPLAHSPCTKDWISPLLDHVSDERLLSRDIPSVFVERLRACPRAVVDIVVNQRLMPIVYDYVVKDIKVGVDNWRVITQPGTSLLNRRQTAVIVRILIEARYFTQLLDFLLWLLGHTRVSQVASLAHRTLRRYTRIWMLLGKFKHAISETSKVYASNAVRSDLFDFEYYRTAQHWHNSAEGDNDNDSDKQDAVNLFELVSNDYESFVSSHSHALLQSGHAPGSASASKEILQLAQQLVRDRVRESIGSTADEIDWAILPCFQKLTRCAHGVTQRVEYVSSPVGGVQAEHPNSPSANQSARQPRLQSMLSHIVADVTQAALLTGKGLSLAPENSPDRAKDTELLRCFVESCALYVRWFAINAGLAKSPEYIGHLLLASLSETINAWTIGKNDTRASSSSSAVGSPLYSVKDIDVSMHVSSMWINSLLAYGCLRIDELVPWLIEQCREEVTPLNIARYTCLTGIIYALGMPISHRLGQADTDDTSAGLAAGGNADSLEASNDDASDGDNGDSSNDLYSRTADIRYQYELLEIGSCWSTALATNQVLRIQVVELVFISASASGRLRTIGASQLATVSMQAAAALAQSAWVQFAVDCIPSSIQEGDHTAQSASEKKYYTMLEIYRANIEKQIEDPGTALSVKRAMLRVLMVLCEGVDPADEGFSAMTTAEVAHRLQETVRRFWNGPAVKGKATTAVSKLATILSSLLMFSSTALEESETSTDAFAVAAGAGVIGITGARADGVDPSGSCQDAECVTQRAGDDDYQMQFVTNATACLAIYIKDTIVGSGPFSCHASSGLKLAFSRQCAGLTDALSALSANTLLKFVRTFACSLLALDVIRLSAVGKGADKPSEHSQKQQTQQESQPQLDKRVSAILKHSHPTDVLRLLDMSFAPESSTESDEMDVDTPPAGGGSSGVLDKSSFADFAIRGAALAKLTQQLVSTLCESVGSDSASDTSVQAHQQQQQQSPPSVVGSKSISTGSLLSTLRDFACGILGQLQAIAVVINPNVAELLSLTLASRSPDQPGSSSFSPIQSTSYLSAEPISSNEPVLGLQNQQQRDLQAKGVSRSNLQDMRMRLAIYWRLQVAQPLCHIMREYPEEFGVGEWLMTLVTLCLSPICQPPLSPAQGLQANDARSGKCGPEGLPGDRPDYEFYLFLLDFTAVISESITSSIRKHTLERLRLVSPIARSAACNHKYADMLGRLFPFDISIASTHDIQPLLSSTPSCALDNPWVWIESLEFVPLASLISSSIPNGGLEGMTPFTLRGTLERENALCSERTSGARSGAGGVATGYLANLRFNTSRSAGQDRDSRGTNSMRRSQVASVRRLQYLENPYFPMQPAFLFPLAETSIPWCLFGGKRRRMDSETRLVWRAQCESAFGPSD